MNHSIHKISALGRFLFYIEISRKKGRFITLNSSDKWYKHQYSKI